MTTTGKVITVQKAISADEIILSHIEDEVFVDSLLKTIKNEIMEELAKLKKESNINV